MGSREPRWHGTTTAERVQELRERLGLEVRCVGDLEAPPKGPVAPKPAPPTRPAPSTLPIAVPTRDPVRRPRDGLQTNPSGPSRPRSFVPGTRTRVEARVTFPETGEESEEITTPTRTFSWRDVTSGLPDDSREEDERQEERRLRGLRGRVKAARTVVAKTSGLAETLASDWRKAAGFFARYGITVRMLSLGVEAADTEGAGLTGAIWRPTHVSTEVGDDSRAVPPSLEAA